MNLGIEHWDLLIITLLVTIDKEEPRGKKVRHLMVGIQMEIRSLMPLMKKVAINYMNQ